MAGPERIHRDPSEYQNSSFYRSGETVSEAMSRKWILRYPEEFKEEVLQMIHPYFAPLKKCFEDLRGILYAPSECPDSDTLKRMKDENFRLSWYRDRHNAILSKCKDVLRKTLAELTEDKGLCCSELNETGGTVLLEDPTAKGKGEPGNPEQALPQSQTEGHCNDAPVWLTSSSLGDPSEKNVERLEAPVPQADGAPNEYSEAQKIGAKRLREEELDPLKDLTNEVVVKRLKLSEGEGKEST